MNAIAPNWLPTTYAYNPEARAVTSANALGVRRRRLSVSDIITRFAVIAPFINKTANALIENYVFHTEAATSFGGEKTYSIVLVYLHQVRGPEWAAKTLPASATSMILCVRKTPACKPKAHTRMQSAIMIGRVIGEPFSPIHSLNCLGKCHFSPFFRRRIPCCFVIINYYDDGGGGVELCDDSDGEKRLYAKLKLLRQMVSLCMCAYGTV